MTNSSEIQELQADLRSGRDSVLSAVEGVSEAEAHQIPEPREWTVVQLLAHITELQSFWVTKAVLITQVDDPQITRTAVENDVRLAAVTDRPGHREDNPMTAADVIRYTARHLRTHADQIIESLRLIRQTG